MNVKAIYTLTGAAILAVGLVTGTPPAAAHQAAPAAPQGAARAGDDSLTCEQLSAESTSLQGEMDAMVVELNGAVAGQMRAARQSQAASTATSIASGLASQIPIIGGLISTVASRAATAPVEAQQDRMLELSERMMTRGTEIGQRMQRVEILRSARCGTGQGFAAPAAPAPAQPEPAVEP